MYTLQSANNRLQFMKDAEFGHEDEYKTSTYTPAYMGYK